MDNLWDFSEFIDEQLAKPDDDDSETDDRPIVHADCGFGDFDAS